MNRIFIFAAIFLIIFAVVLGGLWFLQNNKAVDQPSSGADELTKTNGSTDTGKVQVDVTLATKENQSQIGADPYNLDKQYVFFVEVNTHTVKITDTNMKSSTLLADNQAAKGLRWIKIMASVGHHLNGFLIFDKKADAKQLMLTIKNLGGIPKRTFTWNL